MYEVYKRLRDEKGLTDYKVSQATGIPRSTLTEWKNGKYEPKQDKLLRLSVFFDVPYEVFIRDEQKDMMVQLAVDTVQMNEVRDKFLKLDEDDRMTTLLFLDSLLSKEKYKKADVSDSEVG